MARLKFGNESDQLLEAEKHFDALVEYASSITDKPAIVPHPDKDKEFQIQPDAFVLDNYLNGDFCNKLIDAYRYAKSVYGSSVLIKPHLSEEQLLRWYTGAPARNAKCMFIHNSVFINYNGDIIPCQFFKKCVFGNIKKDNLKKVWESDRYRKFREFISHEKPKICMRCCKN